MSNQNKEAQLNGHSIELKRLNKILFPESSISKGDMIDYYDRISEHLLPHSNDRPVSMHRFPDGIKDEGFYQKDRPDYFPDWIQSVELEKEEGTVDHILCNDEATLIFIANQACITLHTWLSKVGHIHHPDKIVFDLDPPSDHAFDLVKEGAKAIREYLTDEFSMDPFLMTTGSRGLHVVLPVEPENNFDTVRAFSSELADRIADTQPEKFTTKIRKAKREGRLFIDYLRMSWAQTSVVPYSLRAIEGAPVATPLHWDELNDSSLTAQTYTISNIFRRLGQINNLPWEDFEQKRYSIAEPLARLNIN